MLFTQFFRADATISNGGKVGYFLLNNNVFPSNLDKLEHRYNLIS